MEVVCPTCLKRAAWEGNPFRPFCSERCRLLDLGKWLSEEYAIPAEEEASTAEDESDPVE